MTKLAVPIAAKTIEQATGQINAAINSGADIIELRIDYLDNPTVDSTLELLDIAREALSTLPVIVTCRSPQQGGASNTPDDLRVDILVAAIKADANFIDCEYDTFTKIKYQEKIRLALSNSTRTRLILSAHSFKGPFPDLAGIYRHITTTYSAAIPKLVYTANHINDCFAALDLLSRTSDDRIVFCMGAAGLITRILAKKLNSFLTFACLDSDSATAPGQITVAELRDIYRFYYINAQTELFGVIGSPIAHSLSPAVHNACFAKAKMNRLYLPILLEGGRAEFDTFIDRLLSRRAIGFKGFSVTIPHKENALACVQRKAGKVEPLAEIIGAANTLIFGPDDRTSAYNTDCRAAIDAIKTSLKTLEGIDAAVIGAGGVARSLVAGLRGEGAKVTSYNRTVKKAQRLADEFECEYASLDDLKTLAAKLVVNCTSLGMFPDIETTPLPAEYLKKGMTVFDTVYNPPQTRLLKDAKKKRLKTVSGSEMFINQAAAQFKLFTKQEPDTALMRTILSHCLSA
ncbi:MAG: shikimate dehydrogenase [Phycisphaerae bacterium]|jgi:3-dehydroquinate dehydratase/shikimate dehydrogenase